MTLSELAQIIDHTALKPETTKANIVQLCEEARTFGFGAVCVAPSWVPTATGILTDSPVKVATVIGFPHGNTFSEVKAFEANQAIDSGVDELDMVIHIGALKSGDEKKVFQDIQSVVEVAERKSDSDIVVKVILETAFLTGDEKVLGCQLAEQAGAQFVKTSTGFATSGATIEDITLMKHVVGDRLGIKAAGGIRDLTTALTMIKAGATRIGCSSSVSIIQEFS